MSKPNQTIKNEDEELYQLTCDHYLEEEHIVLLEDMYKRYAEEHKS